MVSSTLIMAPALSNSPQLSKRARKRTDQSRFESDSFNAPSSCSVVSEQERDEARLTN